jgi:hypothetical protein
MNGLLEFAHDNQWYEIAFDKRSVHRLDTIQDFFAS